MKYKLIIYFESGSVYKSTHDGLDGAIEYLTWTRSTYFSRKIKEVRIRKIE